MGCPGLMPGGLFNQASGGLPVEKYIIFSLVIFGSQAAMADTVKIQSNNTLEKTESSYIAALKKSNVRVFTDKEIQEKLPGGFSRKVKEIEFSSPYYGWHLGECHRGTRHDIPLKTRIWQDNQKRVWLEYQEPDAHMNKFGVIECGNETDKMRRTLMKFADTATE